MHAHMKGIANCVELMYEFCKAVDLCAVGWHEI